MSFFCWLCADSRQCSSNGSGIPTLMPTANRTELTRNMRSISMCGRAMPENLKWIPVAALLLATGAFFQRAQTAPPDFFADVTQASKVQFTHQASPTSRKYLVESMSGGVAVFDYNHDGLLDIFLV